MGYQKVDEVYGYRLGIMELTSKRQYVRLCGSEIVFTTKIDEAGLFSKDEIIDIFVRLMGTAKRKYFITEDRISFFEHVTF